LASSGSSSLLSGAGGIIREWEKTYSGVRATRRASGLPVHHDDSFSLSSFIKILYERIGQIKWARDIPQMKRLIGEHPFF